MATSYSVKMTFAYEDETTRSYDFSAGEDALTTVKTKIRAVNASLKAGTDNGMSTFFVSDDGASMTEITAAQIVAVTEKVLDLGGNG